MSREIEPTGIRRARRFLKGAESAEFHLSCSTRSEVPLLSARHDTGSTKDSVASHRIRSISLRLRR